MSAVRKVAPGPGGTRLKYDRQTLEGLEGAMEILDITALDYSVVGVRVCEAKHTGTIRKYMEIRESHRRDQRPAGAIATHYRQLLHCTVHCSDPSK